MRTTLLGAVSAALLLVGCSGEPGSPEPAPIDVPTSEAATTAPPTTTTTTGPREVLFDDEQLCELLTEDEAARFGARNPRPTNSAMTGNPQCGWAGDVSIVIDFGTSGSGGISGPDVTSTDIEIAGTAAKLQKTTDVTVRCQVAFPLNGGNAGMATGASVLSGGKGKYEPCDVAKKVAEIVIPKVKG